MTDKKFRVALVNNDTQFILYGYHVSSEVALLENMRHHFPLAVQDATVYDDFEELAETINLYGLLSDDMIDLLVHSMADESFTEDWALLYSVFHKNHLTSHSIIPKIKQ